MYISLMSHSFFWEMDYFEQSVSSGLCEHADPGAHSLHFLTWRLSRTHLPQELDREPPNLNSSVLPSALKTFH